MSDVRRSFTAPRGSFFLFGPRGTGKTSWTTAAFPDALRIDLLDAPTLRHYAARPESLRAELERDRDRKVVVIDEVQRAPALLDVVHQFYDARKDLRFVLTGSSARKLRRPNANWLGGRAHLRTMHPFIASELGDRFDLDRALDLGLLPLVVAADEPFAQLATYHAVYMQQEVQHEGLVRDIGAFARFLEAMSFSHASLLNMSNVARECMVDRRTVQGFVEILEDLLLGVRVEVFRRRAARATAQHPKFYFFDTGVFRAARPTGPADSSAELDGLALEGLVFQHLRAWVGYRDDRNRLYYWRTRSGVEVDFVVYGPDGFWAIEVKSTRHAHTTDLRGLKAFREDYPECKPILVHRGRHASLIDSIDCIPADEFLRGIDPKKKELA